PISLVEVEDDLRGGGVRLAGEHEAGVDLALLQREMLVHFDTAADQLRATGAANTSLARVWSIGADSQCGVEDAFAIRIDGECRAASVENDGYLGRASTCCSPIRGGFASFAWNSSACTWSASTPRSTSTARADSIISRGPQR